MAYTSTEIKTPVVSTDVATPETKAYTVPDDATLDQASADSSQFGYNAPDTSFTQHDVDSGLLNYDSSKANNLTYDGHDVNADNLTANIDQTTPNYATSDNYLTDGAYVENRVNSMLTDTSENSLLTRAQTLGEQSASSRGLLNSSMGTSAGTAALIDQATTIASQDATTQATADLNLQQADYSSQQSLQAANQEASLAQQTAAINSALNTQTANQQWDAQNQSAAIQGALNQQNAAIADAQTTQNAAYNWDATEQQGLISGAQAEQQANISAELSNLETQQSANLTKLQAELEAANNTTAAENEAIMAAFSAQQELIQTNINNQFSAVVAQAQLNADQRTALAGAMQEMANNYEISVQNIMLDANLDSDAKNTAIERLNTIFDQDMNNIASVFGASYSNTTT